MGVTEGESTRPTLGSQAESSLRDYLQVVRRRKWIIVLAVILVPAAAVGFSLRQQAMYSSSAQVLLAEQDLANELTGTPDTSSDIPPDRRAQTQADLAREPQVAQRGVSLAHAHLTAQNLLDASSVSVANNADLLTFSVSNHDPVLASRLATSYATAYVRYRLAIDTAPIKQALAAVEQQIADSPNRGALYDSLVGKETQLRTIAALKTANASLVRTAQSTVQTAPKTVRNGIFGLLLGVFLGLGLAFLREALDARVRSSEEIAARLGLPLLARLPEPPRKLRAANRLAMLADPRGLQAEAFRMLRTNLDFVSLGRDVKTVMVTSAVEQEGKSTTVANLAVACSRAGRRVVLVDLDLRRPIIARFFDVERSHPGVTQVAIGHASLEEALVSVPLTSSDSALGSSQGFQSTNGNGHRPIESVLQVLVAGAIPPDPGEFMGTERLARILDSLRARADLILLDTPPLFRVGDGLALSSRVDAAIVITRMDVLSRGMLTELARLLGTTPVAKLGFVVTGARSGDRYDYGYEYGYAQAYGEDEAERSRDVPGQPAAKWPERAAVPAGSRAEGERRGERD